MLLSLLLALFFSFNIAVFFQENKNSRLTILALIIFVLSAITLNVFYPCLTTPDYKYYTQNYNYSFSNSFLFKDVFVSIQYALISLFVKTKQQTVLIMYILLQLYYLVFAVWLIYTKIEAYKKILFFSLTYFFCSTVLLRNGPTYLLVFVGVYYLLIEQKKRYYIPVLATLFHFSGVLSIISYLKIKLNKKFVLYSVLVTVIILLLIYFKVIDVSLFVEKIKAYYELQQEVNWYHKIWFIFIIGIVVLAFIENKTLAISANILIYLLLYLLALFVHVAPAFRVSLYLLIVYCNIPVINPKFKKSIPKVNLLSLVLVLVFILSFYKTHTVDLF